MKITGYIQTYSFKARDKIIEAGMQFLKAAGLESLSSELFSCVDELIKNAVKANYKFLLIRDGIFDSIQNNNPGKKDSEIELEIGEIIKDQKKFDSMAAEIVKTEDVSAIVREILNQESKLLTIKNRAYKEGRSFTDEEKEKIAGLRLITIIRNKIKERNIKIILKIQADKDFIYIEVTNTAPILTGDLQRIYKKREEHQRYKDEAREHEFFIDNLDTSESGFGLGYAKIDVILANWGLDVNRAVTIISSINTTVMLTLPVEELRKKSGI